MSDDKFAPVAYVIFNKMNLVPKTDHLEIVNYPIIEESDPCLCEIMCNNPPHKPTIKFDFKDEIKSEKI